MLPKLVSALLSCFFYSIITSCAGYKVRTYLAKSLQRRCEAIRNAVKEYNAAAKALNDPSLKELDWSAVSHFSFVEEFALLADTRNDIRDRPWVRPDVREAMHLTRRIDRAREELRNANIEARRLHTSIRDEEIDFQALLAKLGEEQDPLYPAVLEYCTRRRGDNARNMAYLEHLYQLPGFSGNPTPGQRVGRPVRPVGAQVTLASQTAEAEAVAKEATELRDLEGDDMANEETSAILEYLAGLTV